MIPTTFCQSCSMPIDDLDLRGTEKDGSKSAEYCSYCYDKGQFRDPDTTLNEMTVIVKTEMEKRHIPQETIELALNSLPHLKRWKHTTGVL